VIVGLVGRLFRAAARLRPGDAGRDLDHVGAELVRLERRAPPASSR
jgi:hypothetical protein